MVSGLCWQTQLTQHHQKMRAYTSHSKQLARMASSINPIHDVFGNSIPDHLRYFSTCGLSDQPGTEFQQLIENKVITPPQFVGVDHDRDTYLHNIKTVQGPTFLYGEFLYWLRKYKQEEKLNPAVVHFDSPTQMVKEQMRPASQIFSTLSTLPAPIIFIINTTIRAHSNVQTSLGLIGAISEYPGFDTYRHLWEWYDPYEYSDYGLGLCSLTMVKMHNL